MWATDSMKPATECCPIRSWSVQPNSVVVGMFKSFMRGFQFRHWIGSIRRLIRKERGCSKVPISSRVIELKHFLHFCRQHHRNAAT